jgi:hypothetical protein
MKTGIYLTQRIVVFFMLLLLSACAPAGTSTPVSVEPVATSADLPTVSTDTPLAIDTVYQPVSQEVCQILLEDATQSLGLTFTMQMGTAFTDYVSGETGQSCSLTANTDGTFISDPNDALTKLVSRFIGWEEQTAYQAGGPTGAATGMTRDSGLMLISVGWQPSAAVTCPADQPISACPLTPEQKIYTVMIQAAQK